MGKYRSMTIEQMRAYNREAQLRSRSPQGWDRHALWLDLVRHPGSLPPEIQARMRFNKDSTYNRLNSLEDGAAAVRIDGRWYALHSKASAEVFGIDDPRFITP
jgi:hypothetical protein